MITLFGIPNCDKIRQVRKSFKDTGQAIQFHDWRKDGCDPVLIQKMISEIGFDALVNRRGTTWRKLSDEQKLVSCLEDQVALVVANPSLIRRPLFKTEQGFCFEMSLKK